VVIEGVVYDELVVAASVSSNVPPEAAEYHLNVPADDDVALRLTLPDAHTEPLVIDGAAGGVLMVATAIARVLRQVPLSNST